MYFQKHIAMSQVIYNTTLIKACLQLQKDLEFYYRLLSIYKTN